MPIYIDLRKLLPLMAVVNTDAVEYSIVLFKHIINEIFTILVTNINFIFGFNEYDKNTSFNGIKKRELDKKLNLLSIQFDGNEYKRFEEFDLEEEEVKKLSSSLRLSKLPELDLSQDGQKAITQKTKNNRYVSFADISNLIESIPDIIGVKRIICMLDEWSEIPTESQLFLAEMLKRGFITNKFTIKIAAIPNRTCIGKRVESNFVGFEDGGDIFPFNLDNRFIYEINQQRTKDFFNDLLFVHLRSIDKQLGNALFDCINRKSFINAFLANQALKEILIASAGIPRDFINLFINAYDQYILNTSTNNQRIGVKHIRLATIEWYKADKKEQIDNLHNCKIMLERIISEIIIKKKSTHFLIPQKYSTNGQLNQLIDLRVIHLRKKGYSHKGNAGVVYDVYSIDYGCYTSIDVPQSQLDSDYINKINTIDNFREIRRISLEDNFFEQFMLNIGEAIKCPHCNETVDTNSPAYVKKKLCNKCFDPIKDE